MTRGNKPALSVAEFEWVQALRKQGLSVQEIAARTDFARSTISLYLRRGMPKSPVVEQQSKTALGECPQCGRQTNRRYPLQRCLDAVYRCAVCAARWELVRRGRTKDIREDE